jgi:hypothetical protein
MKETEQTVLAVVLPTGEAAAASRHKECASGSVCGLVVDKYPGGKLSYSIDITGSQSLEVAYAVTLNGNQKCGGRVKINAPVKKTSCGGLGKGKLKIVMPVYFGHESTIVASWYG